MSRVGLTEHRHLTSSKLGALKNSSFLKRNALVESEASVGMKRNKKKLD